ncbi:MAG: SDR family NAD(P)-dependent oxidoreductase [Acidimicrobiales bacterium]
MRHLAGKNVIVTGAASGIGRACATRLLEEGVNVVGADLASGPGAGESSDPGGGAGRGGSASSATGEHSAFTVDVTNEESVAALVEHAADRFGRIDGLVNAAGVAGGGPVHLLDAKEWDRVVQVNLFGTFLTSKHVLGAMLEQDEVAGERGSLVTIASIEGIEGTAGGSAYSASKGGVVILTKNIAIDYAGRGIRANAICPGFIDTPMTQGIFGMEGMEEARREIAREHKLGRFGRAEEIASVAAFLLSSDSSFVTGHALVVDGGYTAGRDHGVTRLFGLRGDAGSS